MKHASLLIVNIVKIATLMTSLYLCLIAHFIVHEFHAKIGLLFEFSSTDHSPDGTSYVSINVRFQNSQQKAYIVTLSTRTPVYLAINEKECCHCCIQQLFRNHKFYWRTKEDNLRKASLEHNSFNSALPYRSVVGKHPFLEGKVPLFSP